MPRLDIFLRENFNMSRQYSKELISNSAIKVNGKVIKKPSFMVFEIDDVQIDEDKILKFVGRGGIKLEKALNDFKVNLIGRNCLDIGASTGGFTDCMLQYGADFVYALDVGHGQLSKRLLDNDKIKLMEKTDIRIVNTESFEREIDFIAVDVSFISVTKILKNVFNLTKEMGEVVVLIKPQFEAGKKCINKKGVVKDLFVHKKVIMDVYEYSRAVGFQVNGLTVSPIKGGEGNREYFIYLLKFPEGIEEEEFKKLADSVIYKKTI